LGRPRARHLRQSTRHLSGYVATRRIAVQTAAFQRQLRQEGTFFVTQLAHPQAVTVTPSPADPVPKIEAMGDKAVARAAIRDFLLTRRARIHTRPGRTAELRQSADAICETGQLGAVSAPKFTVRHAVHPYDEAAFPTARRSR
jgi:hypothetical protein